MSDDDEENMEHFAEIVQVDPDFPGAVLSLLSNEVVFTNGTQVHLDVLRDTRISDVRVYITPCKDKHIHVYYAAGCPLAMINASMVLAFAVAMVCDSTGDYRSLPAHEHIDEAVRTLEGALAHTLPGLIEFVRANLSTFLDSLGKTPPKPEGNRGPNVH